jgi:hypothetical protein
MATISSEGFRPHEHGDEIEEETCGGETGKDQVKRHLSSPQALPQRRT